MNTQEALAYANVVSGGGLNPSNLVSEQITGQKPFQNIAGLGRECPQVVDKMVSEELAAAGIVPVTNEPHYRQRNEPKTIVSGELHGWKFERAWYYWVASTQGGGLPFAQATVLHEVHGRSVRVNGHCKCPSPEEQNGKDRPVTHYHVDNQAGLNALAQAIREVAV